MVFYYTVPSRLFAMVSKHSLYERDFKETCLVLGIRVKEFTECSIYIVIENNFAPDEVN